MAIVPALLEPKAAPPLKPTLLAPEPPTIPLVAVTLPVVEKIPATLIPWLVPPTDPPPAQFAKVMSPEVPVVQFCAIDKPWELVPVALLIPLTVIVPVLLVTIPLA
jgi:hypothetical protein